MGDVGFTGTRLGMTPAQITTVGELLHICRPDYLHHGDCVGADDEAASLAHGRGIHVIAHPPDDKALRAFNRCAIATREEKEYHARNRDIVDESDWLIAAPAYPKQQQIGGTWWTVNYAESAGKPVMVVWSDGSLLLKVGKWVAAKS